MTALAVCLWLHAEYDRLGAAYLAQAAMQGAPELARQINMEAVPSVSVHMLAEIDRRLQECPE